MGSIKFIKSAKYRDNIEKQHLEIDCGQKCRFGRCWWFWLPHIKVDPWDMNISWLCFMILYIRKKFR